VPGTASGSNDKVRTILGDTPHVATHYMHASAPADACTLFRDWASEVRLRRGPKSVPTHDGPGGSSTHRGTRAKKNGNTRRTLVTAVSFRALAFDVFYHRRWLDFKGSFWSLHVIPAEAGIQAVGHRTPCVTATRVTRGIGQARGMGRRPRFSVPVDPPELMAQLPSLG